MLAAAIQRYSISLQMTEKATCTSHADGRGGHWKDASSMYIAFVYLMLDVDSLHVLTYSTVSYNHRNARIVHHYSSMSLNDFL